MPRKSDKEACVSFGKGYNIDMPECKECKKLSPNRANKCRKMVNEILSDMMTDKEIDEWIIEAEKKGVQRNSDYKPKGKYRKNKK